MSFYMIIREKLINYDFFKKDKKPIMSKNNSKKFITNYGRNPKTTNF